MLLSFMRHLIMRWPRNCVDSLVTLAHVSAKECSLPFFIVKRTEIYSDVRFLLIKPAYHTGYLCGWSERWSVKRLRIFQFCVFFVSRPGPAALRDTNLKMTRRWAMNMWRSVHQAASYPLQQTLIIASYCLWKAFPFWFKFSGFHCRNRLGPKNSDPQADNDTSVFIDVRLSNSKITFHEIFVLIKFSYSIQRFWFWVFQVFIAGIGLNRSSDLQNRIAAHKRLYQLEVVELKNYFPRN